jgi:hypothetical protein
MPNKQFSMIMKSRLTEFFCAQQDARTAASLQRKGGTMTKHTEVNELEQSTTRDLTTEELLLIVGGQPVDVITGASPPPHVSNCGQYGADDCI